MNVLVVLARVPAPGTGKSRLRGAFGDEAVDRLAGALVADVLSWTLPRVDAVLVAHDGPAALLPPTASQPLLVAQVDGDLGDRIDAAVNEGFRRGATRVVIVGTDCPTLPAESLSAAFDGLDAAGATLVPATDGGWIALGVDRPLRGALRSVRWSSSDAGRETVDALTADGRQPLLLPAWHDIDEPADVGRLRWDAAQVARAPRTAALLGPLSTAAR